MEEELPAPVPLGPGTVGSRELGEEHIPEAIAMETGLGGVLYSALTWLAAPAVGLHIARRRYRGRETNVSMYQRWAFLSEPRPEGPVIWFHAVSIGESAVALPVVFRCMEEHPQVKILFTTSTVEAYSLLKNAIPARGAVLQFAPLDIPWVVESFLNHWKPAAAVFVESELWPNLIQRAHAHGVKLALLNARMSSKSFLKWHNWTFGQELIGGVMSCFSLIVPQSDLDVGRFRLLGAQLWQMPGWCADLKYAAAMGSCVWQMWRPKTDRVEALRSGMGSRDCWVTASTHEGEEAVIGRTHIALLTHLPRLLTVVVPRHPWRCAAVAEELRELGLRVRLWSSWELTDHSAVPKTDVFVVDTVGELPLLFSVAELAFIGGSLFDGSRGHNLAEAAVAGCAILVGPHAGHFSQMAEELNYTAQDEGLATMESLGPSSPSAGGSIPSPMRRFGTPYFARSLTRRRDAEDDEEEVAGGLNSLEDDLSGRSYRRGNRRRTHLGGTPGSWFGTGSHAGSPISPASRASPPLQVDSHNPTPDRSVSRLSQNSRSNNGGAPGAGQPASRLATSSSSVSSGLNEESVRTQQQLPSEGSPYTPRIRPAMNGGSTSDPDSTPVLSYSTPPVSSATPETPDCDDMTPPTRLPAASHGVTSVAPTRLDDMFAAGNKSIRAEPDADGEEEWHPQRRYRGLRLVPPHRLPPHPQGPCVWAIQDTDELTMAVAQLLLDPVERRSRGQAACYASASLASNLVSTVWDILDLRVLRPALKSWQSQSDSACCHHLFVGEGRGLSGGEDT
eukprot:CAMPEP_0117658878 /NCGR_PEP_ID=MMETSP0804-20121206/6107_1 /TAXON_ID=1074897 /ORGANISM="Tetraselmis astigmatica, Strain CCMP880" /LENGTH=788 /DNA_ID=CAMNT_0005465445 /DNA_START=323 /DNA_END=2689 /DNA_ORIENTATION=-